MTAGGSRFFDQHDRLLAGEVECGRGRIVKTTGDGALALFDGPARAVRCARSALSGIRGLGIEARAGVHTGEVELRGKDVGGLPSTSGPVWRLLPVAARSSSSRTVVDLVAGSGLEFAEQGEHELKGIPGTWKLCGERLSRRGPRRQANSEMVSSISAPRPGA